MEELHLPFNENLPYQYDDIPYDLTSLIGESIVNTLNHVINIKKVNKKVYAHLGSNIDQEDTADTISFQDTAEIVIEKEKKPFNYSTSSHLANVINGTKSLDSLINPIEALLSLDTSYMVQKKEEQTVKAMSKDLVTATSQSLVTGTQNLSAQYGAICTQTTCVQEIATSFQDNVTQDLDAQIQEFLTPNQEFVASQIDPVSQYKDLTSIIKNTSNLNYHLNLLYEEEESERQLSEYSIEVVDGSEFEDISLEKIETLSETLSETQLYQQTSSTPKIQLKTKIENIKYQKRSCSKTLLEEKKPDESEEKHCDIEEKTIEIASAVEEISTIESKTTDEETDQKEDTTGLWEFTLGYQKVEIEKNLDSIPDKIAPEDVDHVLNLIDPLNDIESNMFRKTAPSNHKITTEEAIEFGKVDSQIKSNKIHETASWLPNAYDIWKEKYRKLVEEEYPDATKREVEDRLTGIWCKIPDEHRNRYYQKADELFSKYKNSTAAQFSYLNNFKNRPKTKCGRKKSDSGKVHKPKPLRLNKSEDNLIIEPPPPQSDGDHEFSDTNEGNSYDYSKALKETMTYNSPVNKEMKKKLGKLKVYEDEQLDFSNENCLATGFLMDIMMTHQEQEENDLHYTNCSPPEILNFSRLNSLDVSALDNFLTGKESDIMDDFELREQNDIHSEIKKPNKKKGNRKRSNTKRKSRTTK